MSLPRFAFRPALAATLLASALAAGAHAATVVEYTNRSDFPHSPGGQFFYSADPPEQAVRLKREVRGWRRRSGGTSQERGP